MIASYDKQLLQKVFAQDAAIGSVFNLFVRSVSGKLERLKNGGWDKNPMLEKEIDYELAKLQRNLESTVYNSQKWAFSLSQAKNDDLVKSYIEGMAINGKLKDKLFGVNEKALETFVNRKVDGLGLSERVWNIKGQVKEQLGYYLESGIATGRSAQVIAQDVKQILNKPDALFRRVRDKNGKLVPSQPMKAFVPGQGVYCSAHQNAVRLAATETNMAYRMADHSRWQNLDFVVGYEVRLSGSHPAVDICDHMVGSYPKDFVFRGWHPRCFCHAVPVLMSEEEYLEYMDADEETATIILERNQVNAIPDKATKYLAQHKKTIDGWKSTPYWVKDNFNNGKIGAGLKLQSIKLADLKPSDLLFYSPDDLKLLEGEEGFTNSLSSVRKEERFRAYSNLSDHELASIHWYSGNGYFDLNKNLALKTPTQTTLAFERVLNASLDKLPVDEAGVYFRGKGLKMDIVNRYKSYFDNKSVKTERFFQSTTVDPNVSNDFSKGSPNEHRVLFTIISKNGHKIEPLSQFVREKEVLFKSRMKVRVIDFRTIEENGQVRYEIFLEDTDSVSG